MPHLVITAALEAVEPIEVLRQEAQVTAGALRLLEVEVQHLELLPIEVQDREQEAPALLEAQVLEQTSLIEVLPQEAVAIGLREVEVHPLVAAVIEVRAVVQEVQAATAVRAGVLGLLVVEADHQVAVAVEEEINNWPKIISRTF